MQVGCKSPQSLLRWFPLMPLGKGYPPAIVLLALQASPSQHRQPNSLFIIRQRKNPMKKNTIALCQAYFPPTRRWPSVVSAEVLGQSFPQEARNRRSLFSSLVSQLLSCPLLFLISSSLPDSEGEIAGSQPLLTLAGSVWG